MSGISNAVLGDVRKRTDAAILNGQVTRQRVDAIEAQVAMLVDYTEKTELLAQDLANWRADTSFLVRLRWLVTGR